MIKVLVAEDMHVVRAGLVALLDRAFDIDVVAQVGTGDAVLPAAQTYRPDVALLDISMPCADGLTVALELRKQVPRCRPLILTALDQPGYLRRARTYGVSGYLLKSTSPETLIGAVRKVAAGGFAVHPGLAEEVPMLEESPLTRRETEILGLAKNGADAFDIAVALSLSVRTVRNRLSGSVGKLGARTLLDAVRIADRNGWI
ncbi:DNA-binding response regulator [Streptomyces albidoflavus]|uniref:response regulator transcription factor n=1 Tax=Streptomyces albidoflavus TaxID=1886 RepID=UPI000BAE3616|nr:response regulator transcription factor [Streptomyces albidoflavus]MBF4136402.1 response regulator transcription factor [Streptomyces albidoflavus]PAX88773.1 DNA-binding response regulator [Streptomyces albidoflavus]PAX91050.1 DNA-binding response regulator [Streptomyces albidoflavus]PBO19352.1 DNA-binding response regulator [Streptomyces albidoflavus]PBO23748.1 DNA-binding response regulator [Streptomyces albidoflavus]